MIKLNHPTGHANFTRTTIGRLTVWWSYETPIAYSLDDGPPIVSENEWGPTTGKHLNYISDSKATRIPHTTLVKELEYFIQKMELTIEYHAIPEYIKRYKKGD